MLSVVNLVIGNIFISSGGLFFSTREVPLVFLFFVFCLFANSWAAPMAYGGSQARGLIGATATGLHQSHSNAGSTLWLQLTPQLTAVPDP